MKKIIAGILLAILSSVVIVLLVDFDKDNKQFYKGLHFYNAGMYEEAFKYWDGLERYRWDVALRMSKVYLLGLVGENDLEKAKKLLSPFLEKRKEKIGYIMALILVTEDARKNKERIEMFLNSSRKNYKESEFLLAMHWLTFDDLDKYKLLLGKGFYGDRIFKHEAKETEASKKQFYKGIRQAYLGENPKIERIIGQAFLSGKLLDMNIDLAYYWLARAGQSGDLDAAYILYVINKNGLVDKSNEKVIPKNCKVSNKYLDILNINKYLGQQKKYSFEGYCEY